MSPTLLVTLKKKKKKKKKKKEEKKKKKKKKEKKKKKKKKKKKCPLACNRRRRRTQINPEVGVERFFSKTEMDPVSPAPAPACPSRIWSRRFVSRCSAQCATGSKILTEPDQIGIILTGLQAKKINWI